MEKFYTYILQSELNGRFYIGYCSDLEARLLKHNTGATPSTKPYRPWKMIYFEEYSTKKEAMDRESEIKSMKSRIYIENLIQLKNI